MVMAPSSPDVKSAECSGLSTTSLHLTPEATAAGNNIVFMTGEPITSSRQSPLVNTVVDEDSSHTLITVREWDSLDCIDTSPPPFV